MNTFRNKVKEVTGAAKLEAYQTHYNMAICSAAAVEESERPCYMLYVALSHLAQVPELNIVLGLYDNLLFSTNQQYDKRIVDFIQTKLGELEKLINGIIVERVEKRIGYTPTCFV